jgi:hypothetical protein
MGSASHDDRKAVPSLAQFIRKELRGRRGFSFEAASAKDEE